MALGRHWQMFRTRQASRCARQRRRSATFRQRARRSHACAQWAQWVNIRALSAALCQFGRFGRALALAPVAGLLHVEIRRAQLVQPDDVTPPDRMGADAGAAGLWA